MKKSYYILLGLLTYLSPIFGQSDADTVTSASEQDSSENSHHQHKCWNPESETV